MRSGKRLRLTQYTTSKGTDLCWLQNSRKFYGWASWGKVAQGQLYWCTSCAPQSKLSLFFNHSYLKLCKGQKFGKKILKNGKTFGKIKAHRWIDPVIVLLVLSPLLLRKFASASMLAAVGNFILPSIWQERHFYLTSMMLRHWTDPVTDEFKLMRQGGGSFSFTILAWSYKNSFILNLSYARILAFWLADAVPCLASPAASFAQQWPVDVESFYTLE